MMDISLSDAVLFPEVSTSIRRVRPPMIDPSTEDIATRVPLRQPGAQIKDGKGSLRAIFTRNKVEKEHSPTSTSPVTPSTPRSESSGRSARAAADAGVSRNLSTTKEQSGSRSESSITMKPLPKTPGKSASKHLLLNLKARSAKDFKTFNKPGPGEPVKSSTRSSPQPPTRTSTAWDPPPLFQAYPQAIKHAQLSASTLSTDTILRLSTTRQRQNSLRDEFAQTTPDEAQNAAPKKAERAKSKHRRQLSGSISKADWTHKIYVLVTSGYLLQYAGDGSFDRLPEKMMQLGKDSVAFASDVIPGKHWVLQVSRAMDSDGTPASDPRSLLSRLTFRGADYKRTATSLLLVLDSAEDMDSWLAVIRREIEALGGKKHGTETEKPCADRKVMQLKAQQLRAQSSHRYLVRRDPDQNSEPPTPHSQSCSPRPWAREKTDELQAKLDETVAILTEPRSSSVRSSTGHMSVSGSIASSEGKQLDSLKEGTNRLSYVSSGQRTFMTSQCSTPATSPIREISFDDIPPPKAAESVHLRPNAAALNERRRSMQVVQIPDLQVYAPIKVHRHSTYDQTGSEGQGRSPGITPNFSVPNSSSKRYTTANSTISLFPTKTPATMTTATRPRDSVLKGARKGPPAALRMPPPLSPIKGSPESERVTSSQMSLSLATAAKPSVVDIPIRSPPLPSLDVLIPLRKRRSSLIPLSGPELSAIEFHVPRRYSSMQTLCEISEKHYTLDASGSPPPPLDESLESQSCLRLFGPESPTIGTESAPYPDRRPKSRARLETTGRIPVLANTKTKVQRPTSMICPSPPGNHIAHFHIASKLQTIPCSPSALPGGCFFSSQSTSPASGDEEYVLSPSLPQKVKQDGKGAAGRHSLPVMVGGPPPAPPPDCALPPLPLPESASTSARASLRSRGSIKAGA